jgi:hypothetical protein
MLGESKDQVLPVIVKQRPVDYHVCPHCHEEIHEKGVYAETLDAPLRHGKCGGLIEMPPTDWSKVSPEWRALLGKDK